MTNISEIWSKWGKSNKTLICFWIIFSKVVMYFRNKFYDFEWFSWSLSFLLLIFNLWLTFQEIWSKWGKTLICSESLFKGCNVFRNAILWFLSGLVDSLSFLLLIFNLWLNISGDMGIENEEKKLYMFLNHFSKVVNVFRNAILWFWVVYWFLSFCY